jgi:hypothetical protein
MEILQIIFGLVVIFGLPVLILLLRDLRVRKRQIGDNLRLQADRVSLSDEEFCHKERLDSSAVDLVHTIRYQVAKDIGCDPLRIYPDDSFSDFGWSYGEAEMLMGYTDVVFEWDPSFVGEFILEIVRLRKERGQCEHEHESKNPWQML